MVDVVVHRPVRQVVMIVVAAFALGLLAFAADAIDGFAARQVVTVLVSSGLAWGLAALLAGRSAPDRRGAVVGATTLLVSATLVYYLLIIVVSRRWSGGSLVDGSSADWYSLRSVAVMTVAWLLVSVVAGPSLGLLGQMTRTAPVPGAALAAGVACGLLSGQGWREIMMTPPGLPWAIRSPDAVFVHGIGTAQLSEIIVPLAVLVWLATRRRPLACLARPVHRDGRHRHAECPVLAAARHGREPPRLNALDLRPQQPLSRTVFRNWLFTANPRVKTL